MASLSRPPSGEGKATEAIGMERHGLQSGHGVLSLR